MQTRMELAVTEDITAGVRVVYEYRRGFPQTREQPGESPDIEIHTVEFDWLHVWAGFDLEILRETRNVSDRETIDAWIWNKCDDEIREHCRREHSSTADWND